MKITTDAEKSTTNTPVVKLINLYPVNCEGEPGTPWKKMEIDNVSTLSKNREPIYWRSWLSSGVMAEVEIQQETENQILKMARKTATCEYK